MVWVVLGSMVLVLLCYVVSFWVGVLSCCFFVISRGEGCFGFRRFGFILLIFVFSGGVGYLGSVVFVLLC